MHINRIIPIILLALLAGLIVFAVAGQSHAGSFEGRVIGIADGDTITVLAGNNQQVKIRLYGIDTPESKQDFGTKAKQFISRQVF